MAQNDSHRRSSIDRRTTRHRGYEISNVRRLLRMLASTGILNEFGTSDVPTHAMHEEMERIYREMLARTRLALRRNHEVMDRIVEPPLEKEEIDFEEVQETFLICGCQRPAAAAPLDQDVDQPQDQIEEIPAAAEVLA